MEARRHELERCPFLSNVMDLGGTLLVGLTRPKIIRLRESAATSGQKTLLKTVGSTSKCCLLMDIS